MTGVKAPRDRRHVTILFVDTVGSTALIEKLEAERAHQLLTPALQIMIAEIRRASGHVSQVMGDGLMGIFGVPYTLEDHATRAALAALAIQEKMGQYGREAQDRYGVSFQVRIGLNSGTVIVAASGDGDNEIFDAIGSPVHLASRVETQTPAGGIGVSRHTYQLIAADFELQKLGSYHLKGFSEPETVYSLVRARSASPRRHGGEHASSAATLVGRKEQLALLESRFARARSGVGGLVMVTGEAGVGKTRFLTECRRGASDLLWLQGQSSSYDQRLGYWPFVEMLKSWMALSDSDAREHNWDRLVAALSSAMGEESGEVIPYIASMMGFEVREPYLERVRYLDTDTLGRQILRAVRRLMEQLAERQPLMVVIDDFHWSDESSADLVLHLLDLCVRTRLIVCVLSRPDEGPAQLLLEKAGAISGLEITAIDLNPLRVEESIQLLEKLIGRDSDLPDLRDQILYKAGGNPFFIEEVVHSLIASGALVTGSTPGTLSMAAQAVSIPDTIHDVIMARVDRLDARLKQILHIASVIGRNFLYGMLKSVARDDDALDEEIGQLRQRQFIEQAIGMPEIMYMFRHALTQEAVYDSLLSERRMNLHKQVADGLLEVFAGRTHSVASVLAFHYARAGLPKEALRYLLEAGEQAIKVAADSEALKYYEEALATYAKVDGATWEPWQKAIVECRLGEAHYHRGNQALANAHFENALRACSEPLPSGRMALFKGFAQQLVVQLLLRLRGDREAVAGPELALLDRVRYRSMESHTWVLMFLDMEKMGYVILRMLNTSEKLSFGEGVAKGSSAFGAMLDVLGLNRLARPYYLRALHWAEKSGNVAGRGIARTFYALHQTHVRRWPQALEDFAAADQDLTQTGDLSTWTANGVYRALLLLERGQFQEALALGLERVALGRDTAMDVAIRTGLMVCGAVLRRTGQVPAALGLLEQALARCVAVGDHLNATQVRGEMAQCLCQLGRLDAARSVLQEALHVVRERRIMTYTTIYVFLAACEHEVAARQSATASPAAARLGRYRRPTDAFTRRFAFGRVQALRLFGTCAWLQDRQDQAGKWWDESLAMARELGAAYEEALTRIERGQRTGNPLEAERGEAIRAACAGKVDIAAALALAGSATPVASAPVSVAVPV